MYKFKIKSDGEGGILYMTREEKLKFYKEVKKKIAQDGKSHSSMLTKDGAVIDGKLHPLKKTTTPQNKKIR